MSSIETKTKEIRALLFPIIGETKAKTTFSYYGIFKDDILFALYKDNNFYLRVSDIFAAELLVYEETKPLQDPNMGIHAKNFYFIPPYILNNLQQYSHWIINTIQEISTLRQKNNSMRKNLIRSLPNMNINIERTLKKLGINSVDEFIKRGEISIFVDLIKMGIDVNHIMLFKLYGAITHKYIYTLSQREKQFLLKEVNIALYQAGLRKRFNIE
ncbi:TfoX/Sxy family DNA transformation protein [Glaesserella sp.]|uniref:TfoX/Sxy family DNA transformation protein n=1 Tax=Glaesserella sp. TaxID=2094731 RepID=UPI00359F9D86